MFSNIEQSKILRTKVAIRNYLDKNLTPLFGPLSKHFFYLSGGAIASLLQDEEPKDWDLYCRSAVAAEALIERAKIEQIVVKIDEKYIDSMKLDGNLLITANACTLKNKIQIITKLYGEPRDIRATFDYKHCTPYYDCGENMLYISEQQYNLIINKKLMLNNPLAWTAHRQEKFINRGYTWAEHNQPVVETT